MARKVAVAEEYRVGGTCVIRGCVPKKLLVYGSHFAEDLKDAQNFGWTSPTANSTGTCCATMCWRDVDRLNGLYGQTLNNHKVTMFKTRATIIGPQSVQAGQRAGNQRRVHPDRDRRAAVRPRVSG